MVDSHKARIFIVEDEPIIADDLADFLQSEGYFVVGIAHDSESALDMIHSETIDLVLLDINIEGSKDGIEIGRIINDQYKLPFIFITSFSDDVTMSKVVDTHPYGYIVKPFEERTLKTTISLALHNFRSEQKEPFLSFEKLNQNCIEPLTAQQYQILIELSNGLNNSEIADKLFVSRNTIKFHLKNIYYKLDVGSRMDAVKKLMSS